MSLSGSDHPDARRLRSFALGLLDAQDQRRIEHHVMGCEECGRIAREQADDSFLAQIRHASVIRAYSDFRDWREAGGPVPEVSDPSVPTGGACDGIASREPTLGGPAQGGAGEPEMSDLAQHPRYRILERIGSGGMGAVYRAEHRLVHRIVALKVIHADRLRRAGAVERFHREAELAGKLDHPNIVAVLDADQAGDTHMMVQEFVPGMNLAEWVYLWGPLSQAEACRYARQVALGLQHAHERGLVHRDIKPGNLLRTVDGQVKITDFGLARLVSDSTIEGLTGENEIMGTADYVAPEQIRSAHTCDIRADLYGLGCTLFFLLTGQAPFANLGVMEKLQAHLEQAPPSLSELRSDVSPDLAGLVSRLLEKDPRLRPQSPLEVAEALEPFTRDVTESAWPPDLSSSCPKLAPPQVAENRGRGRFRTVALALAFCGLLGAAGMGGALLYFSTNYGQLEITTTDPDVEVVVTRNGQMIRVIDPRAQVRVSIPVGIVDLAASGLGKLQVEPPRLVIERGGKAIATVRRLREPDVNRPLPPAAPVPGPPAGEGRLLVGQASVNDAAFLPDGRHAVTVGRSPDLVLWDVMEGRLVHRFNSHPDIVWVVAVSPDGTMAATGGQDKTGSQDFAIRLWDLDSGREVRRLSGHTGIVSGLRFTPDGKRLVSTGWDRSLRFWKVQDGELISTQRYSQPLTAVAISADGRLVATGTISGEVLLWDAATGGRLSSLVGHVVPSGGLSFLPDHRHLLSAPTDVGDTVALFWDLDTGRPRQMFQGHTGYLLRIAASPDGQLAATGSADQTVRLWDVARGREIKRYDGFTSKVGAIAFSPDGRTLLGGSDNGVLRVWTVPPLSAEAPVAEAPAENLVVEPMPPPGKNLQGEIWRFRSLKERIGSMVFTEDGRAVVVTSDHVDIEHPRGGIPSQDSRFWTVLAGPPPSVRTAAPSAMRWVNCVLMPAGRRALAVELDGTLVLYDLATLASRELSRLDRAFHWASFSPDGLQAALSVMNRVEILDLKSGKILHTLKGHRGASVGPTTYTLDGTRLITGGRSDATIIVWDAATGKEIRRMKHDGDTVLSLVVFPDGNRLASSAWDRTVRIWDLATGRELRRIHELNDQGAWLSLSPDGVVLVAGYLGEIRFWDTRSGQSIGRISIPDFVLNSTAIAPDSRRLAVTGFEDHTLRFFTMPPVPEPAAIEEAHLIPPGSSRLSWDTAISCDRRGLAVVREGALDLWDLTENTLVRSLALNDGGDPGYAAFTADGRFLITNGGDNSIRLWDAKTLTPVRVLARQARPVSGLAVSPDGRLVASGSVDVEEGTNLVAIHLWDIETGAEVGRVGGPLGRTLQLAFLPDGRHLVSTNGWKNLTIWDIQTGTLTWRLDRPNCLAIAPMPDGRHLMVGSGTGLVELLNVKTGAVVREFQGLSGTVITIAVSPDGRFLLATAESAAGNVRVWDIATGQHLVKLDATQPGPAGWMADSQRFVFGEVPHAMFRVYRLAERLIDAREPQPPRNDCGGSLHKK